MGNCRRFKLCQTNNSRSELPHFKNGSGGRPPKFGRTYDEKGGHSIKQEDRWQKWANLGGQIAKNAMVNGGKGGQMAKMGKFGRTNSKNALVNVLPNGRTKCQKEGRAPKGRTCGSSDASTDFFFIFLCYYKEVHHFLWPGGYLHCFKMAKRGGSSEIHCGNGRHLLEPDLQIELNPLAIF